MPLTPTITQVTPASYSLADVLTALGTHFAASSIWNKDSVGISDSDGLVLSPVNDPGGAHQVALRHASTTALNVSIAPNNGITALSGSTWVGTDATYSGESDMVWTAGNFGASSKIWVVEFADAFFIMFKKNDTQWENSVHAGRVAVPYFPAVDVPLGRDGLGFFVGAPTSANAARYWLGSSSGGKLRMASEKWVMPYYVAALVSASNTDVVANFGFIRPGAITPVMITFNGGIGEVFLRYVMSKPGAAAAPMLRYDVDNTTDEAWIMGGERGFATAVRVMIPWLRTVTP